MAIHDVDKNTNDRGAPQPNSHDLQGVARMAHNTTSITPTTDSSNTQRLVFKNNLLLTYDDMGRVSSVYGYIPGLANYPVLIIANYGFDVYTDILGLTAPTV